MVVVVEEDDDCGGRESGLLNGLWVESSLPLYHLSYCGNAPSS